MFIVQYETSHVIEIYIICIICIINFRKVNDDHDFFEVICSFANSLSNFQTR